MTSRARSAPVPGCRMAAALLVMVGVLFLLFSRSAFAISGAVALLSDQDTTQRLQCYTGRDGDANRTQIRIVRITGGELLQRLRFNRITRRLKRVRIGRPSTVSGPLLLEIVSTSRHPTKCILVSGGKRTAMTLKAPYVLTSDQSAALETTSGCERADLNGDQTVDGFDVSVIINQYGSDSSLADINGDGLVNGLDLSVLLACANSKGSSGSFSSGTSSSSSSSSSSAVPEEAPPVLVEGPGFTGQTAEPPSSCASGIGCSARPAAHWNVVPFQTVTDRLDLGVVAFHMSGIARVSFSLSNGPWVDVLAPSMNVSTGVREYVARIDASQMLDGTKELRAIAYPNSGTPRVLESLSISANFGGSLPTLQRFVSPAGSDSHGLGTETSPFRSILRAAKSIQDARGDGRADGGIINLLPGSYSFGPEPGEVFPWYYQVTTSSRWLVIRPAPGVSREEVELARAHPEGLKTRLVKVEGVTVRSNGGSVLTDAGSIAAFLWIDGARLRGPGRDSNMSWVGYEWRGGKYVTASHISDSRSGIEGARLQRGVLIERIGSDAFSNSSAVINSEARDIRAPNSSSHPDVYQFFRTGPNVVLYGLIATTDIDSQGIFIKDTDAVDVAIVDCDIDVWADDGNQPQPGIAFQVDFTSATSVNHLYISHSNFVGPSSWDARVPTSNSVIEQSSFTPDVEWSVPGLQYR